MKKILFIIVALFTSFTCINASGMNFSVTCPEVANPSSEVSCTIKVGSTTSGELCAISSLYSITGGTKKSFTSPFSELTNSATGFIINIRDINSCVTSNTTIGTLNVTMPTSGESVISFSKIQASNDAATVKSTASDVSKTIRVKSSVNTLSALSVSGGTLSPTFNSSTTSYTATVDATSTTISATVTDSHSTVTGTGSKNLSYGNNEFSIVVKSETGSEKTYTIKINRPDNRNDDNTLKSLTLSSGTLSPSFTSSVNSYTATVAGSISKINITAITNNSSATLVSGYGSREADLKYGTNTIEIKVKSEKGTEKTYKVVVTRTDDRDTVNTLATLTLSNGTLSPKFDQDTLNYTATVESSIDKLTINASLKSNKSSFVSGYGSRNVNLEYGKNTILIKVKSENEVEKVYKIIVTRTDDRSNNSYLGTLSIEDLKLEFNKQTTEYALTVPYDKESVIISATAEDNKSTIAGIGTKELKEGANVITIVVTAENGETKTYKITITKLTKGESVSSNTNLKSFAIANHNIDFKSDINTYSITLNENENLLNLSYLTEDESSVVTVNGNENLKNGSVVKVSVTSTDGSVKVYTINIIKKDVEKTNNSKNLLNILLSVLSLLIIIGVVVAFVLISKKKKKSIDSQL